MDHVISQPGTGDSSSPKSDGVAGPLPASYNSRFGAFIFDLLFYVVLVYLIGSVLNRYGIDHGEDWAFYVIAPVPYWIGFVALGVTPASWLCNIRIVDQRNRAPGLRRALRRSLIPGTVWAFVVPGFALFDQRIDAFFEANPGFLGFLLFIAFLALMCFFCSYLRKAYKDDLSTVWHDAIAGTRVIEFRSARRAALAREIAGFRKALGRAHALPPQAVQTNRERKC